MSIINLSELRDIIFALKISQLNIINQNYLNLMHIRDLSAFAHTISFACVSTIAQSCLLSSPSLAASAKSLVQRVRLSLNNCIIVAESLYSSSSSPSRSAMALSNACFASLHAWSGEFKIS